MGLKLISRSPSASPDSFGDSSTPSPGLVYLWLKHVSRVPVGTEGEASKPKLLATLHEKCTFAAAVARLVCEVDHECARDTWHWFPGLSDPIEWFPNFRFSGRFFQTSIQTAQPFSCPRKSARKSATCARPSFLQHACRGEGLIGLPALWGRIRVDK